MKLNENCKSNHESSRDEVRVSVSKRVGQILFVALIAAAAIKKDKILQASDTTEAKIEINTAPVEAIDYTEAETELTVHENLVESYAKAFQERYDVVMFADSTGNILGEVDLSPLYRDPTTNELVSENELAPCKVPEIPHINSLEKIETFDEDKLNQDWIDAWREKIAPEEFVEERYPFYRSTSGFLRYGIKEGEIDSSETFTDVVWRRSQDVLGNGMTRLDYLKEVLKDLPSEELKYLATYGEVGIESTFSDEANSGVALGAFQFVRGTARRYGLKVERGVDERKDFVKAAGAFREYLTDIHEKMAKLESLNKIEDDFGLQDEWFISYATINGYHSGENRIIKMLDWFAKNYEKKDAEEALGENFSSKDLYTFMTQERKYSRIDKGFGSASMSYHLQLTAMAELLAGKDATSSSCEPAYYNYDPPEFDQNKSYLNYCEDSSNIPYQPVRLPHVENPARD